METVTVVIPALNEEKKIEDCLVAVLNQSYPCEVIVADACSKDGTVEIAKQYNVKVVKNKYIYRAGGCQAGVEAAGGDIIAFTDADCVPETDWIKNLMKEMDFAVGLSGATKYELGEGLWVRSINLSLGTLIGSGDSVQWRTYPNKHKIKSPSGCNSMYRKDAIIKAGGFNVKLSGGEDEDLNKRIKGDIYYVPNAIVWHNHKMTGLVQFSKRMFKYGKWKVENGTAWFRAVSPALFAPLALIILVSYPLLGLLVGVLPYFMVVLWYSFKVAKDQGNWIYLFTLPVVYFFGHVSYTIGFWSEVVRKLLKRE